MRIRIIRYHDHVGGRENRPNLGVKTWSGFFENALAKAKSPFSIRDIEASNNVVNSLNSLKDSVENAFRSGDFPIIISDNHVSAIGTINGALEIYKKKLGLIWIDAHTDIHSPFTTHTGNLHGMPVAALMQVDHNSSTVHHIDDEQLQLWNSLKDLQNHEAQFHPRDLIYIGIRDSEPEELEAVESLGIAKITAEACRSIQPERAIEIIKAHFADHERIFISFDLDSLDPQHAMGVSVPANQGLELTWAKTILETFIQDPRIVGIELTEYNPDHDENQVTAETCQSLSNLIVDKLVLNQK